MNMQDVEKSFFMEGTLRICGSLDIEKALGDCFDFIRQHLPGEEIYLHHYLRDTGSTHIFAMADHHGGRSMDLTVNWPKHLVKWLESDSFPHNVIVNNADEHPLFEYALQVMQRSKYSILLVRLVVEESWVGAATLWAKGWNRFKQEHLDLFLLLKRPFTIAMSNNRQYKALMEIRDTLADDKNYLQQQLQASTGNEVIGAEFGLKQVMEMVQQVSTLDSPVLLRGETGTGKEVIANTIHNISSRRKGPFIKVNCGAIPESLMDSELFGYEKGAFTGAMRSNRGRFERADGGTIFLDEIGELSLDAQVRLLRVLQDKTIERVGGNHTIKVNIRVIAATHRDLEKMIRKNHFREDLFFRLQVFPIIIPPLRQRKKDIPALVQHFLIKKSRELGFAKIPSLVNGSLELLAQYDWPGNVRELENMVERALILNPGGPIGFENMPNSLEYLDPKPVRTDESNTLVLDEVISKHIQAVLNMTKGKVNGKDGAAQIMGMNPSTLRHKMRKMKIPFGRNVNRK
jgi:transcriptional regulator with GAF, ATPase, and Fis domain